MSLFFARKKPSQDEVVDEVCWPARRRPINIPAISSSVKGRPSLKGWHVGVTTWTWWRHQMETFSALLALCAGNSPVTGEFPSQRPVTRSFDISLTCAWTNRWVNNRDAGDLSRRRARCDITVMLLRVFWGVLTRLRQYKACPIIPMCITHLYLASIKVWSMSSSGSSAALRLAMAS